jgi:tRNA A37 threonylcarbamoyladenosine dehydratase
VVFNPVRILKKRYLNPKIFVSAGQIFQAANQHLLVKQVSGNMFLDALDSLRVKINNLLHADDKFGQITNFLNVNINMCTVI